MAMYDAGGAGGKFTAKQGNGQPEGEMDALLLGITKELVASSPSQRNYKGILIALLVICVVCGLILLAIYLLRPPDDGPRVKGKRITIEDLTSKRFAVKPFNGTWISETHLLLQDHLDRIISLDVEGLGTQVFVDASVVKRLNPVKFSISPDRKFVLLVHDVELVWEHSTLAKYTLFDVEQKTQIPIHPSITATLNSNLSAGQSNVTKLQYAEWVGPHGHSLVAVCKNDIYYYKDLTDARQITTTGEHGIIFNGVPDWLYEVEILKSPKAFWMSPNGKTMIYASFNDWMVGEASFPFYGDRLAYPELKTLRYPKAGTTNPEVKIWAVDIDSSKIRPTYVQSPKGIDSRDHYISSVKWIDTEEFSVVWMNRDQNQATFATCSAKNKLCHVIYVLKPPGIGWLDFPDQPLFSSDKSYCLLRIPWRDGEAGYFDHIIWLDLMTGKEIPITNGPYQVTSISAWNQMEHVIYFTAAPPGKPGQRHLYSVSEKSSNSSVIISPICMTCPSVDNEIDSKESDKQNSPQLFLIHNCLYNQVTFNHERPKYYVNECLGPEIPSVSVHYASTGELEPIIVLNDNSALRAEVAKMALPRINTTQVLTASGFLAQVKQYLPPGFQEDEGFRFPCLLHIDGAPGSQLVSEKWEISWASYLASQKNFIVVEIDARGSGFQGETLKQTVYKNLGEFEVTDQLEVLQYLIENGTFIDEKNMAVWGWGYGGYLTLRTLAEDRMRIFRGGISVAPITKWEFYDSAFTERYLGMPNFTENYHGYEEGDLVRIVPEIRGQNFMLIHGSADEKVHYQHSLYFTKQLINQGIAFKEQVYPDEGHSLAGVNEHFYRTMEAFLDSIFEAPDWDEWERANFLGIPI